MKVAFVSFGHADSAVSIAKYLSAYCDVDLFFTFSLDRKVNNIIDFQRLNVSTGLQPEHVVKNAFSEEVKSYLKDIHGLKLFMYQNLSLKSLRNWKLSLKFARILRKYDVVHFNGDHGILPQLILFLYKKKLVFSIHDWNPHSGETKVSPLKNLLRKWQIKSNKSIIIQNKVDYKSLIEANPKKKYKIHYVPFGYLEIYHEYDKSKNEDNNCFSDILFFGRISKYKGIDYLLEAFEIVIKKIENIKLIIAGSGDFHFDVDKYKSDNRITFLHKFLDSREMVQLIKNTKVVVCPYTDATQSGVAMTSFAFNKPVIATNTGSFPEIIFTDINGLLIQPKNAIELADAIIKMLSNEEVRSKMETNIKNKLYLEEFDWINISNKIYSIYINEPYNKPY